MRCFHCCLFVARANTNTVPFKSENIVGMVGLSEKTAQGGSSVTNTSRSAKAFKLSEMDGGKEGGVVGIL